MNSIAYWLIQNNKKYKKRDYYKILSLKASCKDIEKKAKKLGSDKLVAMYTMALIKDNKSLDFLPNYVTLKDGTQIDKAEYVDMAIRTEAYIRANKRLPAIVYRMSTLPNYKDSTMKLFTNTFNFKGNTIDEALAVIAKKKLYSKYFDSQKTDKKTINDASQAKGSNCVDWGQVYYRIAKSLGYDVQFVHVKCRVSGTGHIRLRLKHKNHILGNWINCDYAAVVDTTSGNVSAIWCRDG
ncbi:hypothetical protein [Methanobrevibacter sp.]|uniref:hypothetical protein n=1 Tax=Methanobrevibacter sp. TaxID=66852 RepID=UPI002E79E7B8|nr:hypothetical protein [Methanobrevibacter sp.]MEE0025899.1 hypothetical protein [Methanobrevibacter sp.]